MVQSIAVQPVVDRSIIDPTSFDAATTLVAVRQNRLAMRALQANELLLLTHFADIHSVVDQPVDEAGVRFGEQLVEVGHDGTPEVGEFATFELAAALGERVEALECDLGLALDLRHRLPSLWQAVLSCRLKRWVAFDIVQRAAELDRDRVGQLDAVLRPMLGTLGPRRLVEFAREQIVRLSPPEELRTAHEQALETREVRVWHEGPFGVSRVSAVLDSADAVALDSQLGSLAHILLQGGHSESLEQRRAVALGILATPARALQLQQASLLDELPDDLSGLGPCPSVGQPGHACGAVTVDPERLLPKAQLILHVSDADLITSPATPDSATCDSASDPGISFTGTSMSGNSTFGTAVSRGSTSGASVSGVARCRRLGPQLLSCLSHLLGDRRVSVRPVLEPAAIAPVDGYRIPDAMREAVQLRNSFEVFPFSTRDSARCDLDHTDPWSADGTPGQTRLDNLGPLSRRAHRAKTFGRWRVRQVQPGIFWWISPTGFEFLVTPSGSTLIREPDRAQKVAAIREPVGLNTDMAIREPVGLNTDMAIREPVGLNTDMAPREPARSTTDMLRRENGGMMTAVALRRTGPTGQNTAA